MLSGCAVQCCQLRLAACGPGLCMHTGFAPPAPCAPATKADCNRCACPYCTLHGLLCCGTRHCRCHGAAAILVPPQPEPGRCCCIHPLVGRMFSRLWTSPLLACCIPTCQGPLRSPRMLAVNGALVCGGSLSSACATMWTVCISDCRLVSWSGNSLLLHQTCRFG